MCFEGRKRVDKPPGARVGLIHSSHIAGDGYNRHWWVTRAEPPNSLGSGVFKLRTPPLVPDPGQTRGVLKKTIISLRNPYIELQIGDKQGGFLKRGGFLN